VGSSSALVLSLVRAIDAASSTSAIAALHELEAPAFDSACLALFATLPASVPAFVRASAASRQGSESIRSLAQHALNLLPPAIAGLAARGTCGGVLRTQLATQAELLCLAGLQGSGMWLALHPPVHSEQPDWTTAVRLLERECGTSGGCSSRAASLAVVPLMFEILAARVYQALGPLDDSLVSEHDESEALASCVAHLFIAAKAVAALVGEGQAPAVARKVRALRRQPVCLTLAAHIRSLHLFWMRSTVFLTQLLWLSNVCRSMRHTGAFRSSSGWMNDEMPDDFLST
jgi:hypothetical protein